MKKKQQKKNLKIISSTRRRGFERVAQATRKAIAVELETDAARKNFFRIRKNKKHFVRISVKFKSGF